MYSLGKKLKKLRESRGLSQEELAEKLNKEFGTSINKGMISKWENEIGEPRLETARVLSTFFRISLDDLLGLGEISEPVFVRIPVLGNIAAGRPILANEHIQDWDVIPKPNKYKEGEFFALIVKGDSMIGSRIYEGDKVIVRIQPWVEDGEIAVVNVDGENATLKRVKYINGKYLLIADNPKYEPIVIENENARIVGKVIQVIFDPNKK